MLEYVVYQPVLVDNIHGHIVETARVVYMNIKEAKEHYEDGDGFEGEVIELVCKDFIPGEES